MYGHCCALTMMMIGLQRLEQNYNLFAMHILNGVSGYIYGCHNESRLIIVIETFKITALK